ncbi:hypothetical protein ACLB1M_32355 [Escherichia coli]
MADDIHRLTNVFALGQAMIKRLSLFGLSQTVHTGIESSRR